MTAGAIAIVLVWWWVPALILVLRVRRASAPERRVAGAVCGVVTSIVLCILIVRSEAQSSTGAIGFVVLGPLVWLAVVLPSYLMTWRRT